ncbi:GntR family transcriptional regulator [Paenibacillus sp. HWE-109]|uniref:GntR family transcriptional regulator n=1 Tax=Paenibacillus sp. HWE-109 TaxID=1306526 RepID=UPI001EDEC5BB|nr:GntR family transcriptional regulator [Paenibacillus sp. HWE-109]UKS28313.1 GntR family transcriptional regulator [Paenibacillus sp. HWE-109]
MLNDARVPLYLQIQEHFKNRIMASDLKENDRIPSEKELMEFYGVSRITVANALGELAKTGWIHRIPGRGSFVQARELVEDTQALAGEQLDVSLSSAFEAVNKRIGLVIPKIEDFFAIRLLKGINHVLNKSGCELVIYLTENSSLREKEAIGQLIRIGVEGLLIFPIDAEQYNEDIIKLKMDNYPFVLIDRYLPGIETSFVNSNGGLGAELAVNYLWELGHRNIAICSDSPSMTVTVQDRINGYIKALKLKGALLNPALILVDFTIDESGGVPESHTLYPLMKNKTATAYITLNSRLGVHVSKLADQLGLHVPSDISIITFDNPFMEIGNEGVLSYISQSEEEIGAEGAKILLQLLTNKRKVDAPYSFETKTIKPKLVIRDTTGPRIQTL